MICFSCRGGQISMSSWPQDNDAVVIVVAWVCLARAADFPDRDLAKGKMKSLGSLADDFCFHLSEPKRVMKLKAI